MHYGADYNPEQWDRSVWPDDVRLMQQAGVGLVAINIFGWSSINPAEGVWDFTALDEIIALLHEGGIRTPMLARWPGVIAPGKSSKHISGFQDVLPTICELIGQPVPKQNDGISFLPTLQGEKQKCHEYLYFEFCKSPKQKIYSQAIRMGDWKAYRQVGKPLELFNLAKDPFEKSNIAKANSDLSRKMVDLMKQAHAPLPVRK